MGGLQHEGEETGIMFGVLKDILSIKERFDTEKLAFCFDAGKTLRAYDYKSYKAERPPMPDAFRGSVEMLRMVYLKQIGFENVLWWTGYEADDLIAKLCEDLPSKQRAIVVTADKDMYQLLCDKVKINNPNKKRLYTAEHFREEWGIEPQAWIDVKAMAGCKSDGIKGIQGVGEKTACKFLTGKLKNNAKAFKSIVDNNKLWRSNHRLVCLPYPGLKTMPLEKTHNVTPQSWKKFCKRFGMHSIADLDLPPRKVK